MSDSYKLDKSYKLTIVAVVITLFIAYVIIQKIAIQEMSEQKSPQKSPQNSTQKVKLTEDDIIPIYVSLLNASQTNYTFVVEKRK